MARSGHCRVNYLARAKRRSPARAIQHATRRRGQPTCDETLSAMLRWLTAGESHGPALVAILEGLPAGVEVTSRDIAEALARRRLGYGRGARMKFEQDQVDIQGGIRHGRTLGSPVAIRVAN